MDTIHSVGVDLAGILQHHLHGSEKFWLVLTYLGDPGTIFLLYFPVAYALNHRLGVTVLWLALVCEWLNLVLKWFLFGERPFWWIHNPGISGLADRSKLTQFPSTCETGPGSPSGHCMITGAALWPLMKHFKSRMESRSKKRFIPVSVYALLMLGIGISRIFILAHFPHQVLAGIASGVLLGYGLSRYVPHNQKFVFYGVVSLSMLLGAIVIYWGMSAFGIDLSWSIHLATKWCRNADWIRPETRPFSSITRSAGNALGLGCALRSPLFKKVHFHSLSLHEKGASLALSILFVILQQSIPLPISIPILYYMLNFLRNALCPMTVIVLVPLLIDKVIKLYSPPPPEPKSE